MKKYILLLLLTTQLLGAEEAVTTETQREIPEQIQGQFQGQTNPEPQAPTPASQEPMREILTPAPQVKQKPKIALQIQASEEEIAPYGLKLSEIQAELASKLGQAGITVEQGAGLHVPVLLLRVKTVVSGEMLATFVQLAFFEEAELSRNRTLVSAMTWSQASLLTTAKKDFASEVTKTVQAMANAFLTEYNKAFIG